MRQSVCATAVIICCLLIGCIADTTMNQKTSSADLQAGLRSVVEVIEPSDRAEVLFFLENISTSPVRILPWNTPLEGELTADIFDVSVGDVSLQYQGIMIKRVAPTDDDYITIAVGERREVVIDLAESYDMTATGTYRIGLRSNASTAACPVLHFENAWLCVYLSSSLNRIKPCSRNSGLYIKVLLVHVVVLLQLSTCKRQAVGQMFLPVVAMQLMQQSLLV